MGDGYLFNMRAKASRQYLLRRHFKIFLVLKCKLIEVFPYSECSFLTFKFITEGGFWKSLSGPVQSAFAIQDIASEILTKLCTAKEGKITLDHMNLKEF